MTRTLELTLGALVGAIFGAAIGLLLGLVLGHNHLGDLLAMCAVAGGITGASIVART